MSLTIGVVRIRALGGEGKVPRETKKRDPGTGFLSLH